MNIKPLHPNFILPTRATDLSGGYDIYMPEAGVIPARADKGIKVGLGFAAAVPIGHIALIAPRSGKGTKEGVALNNTVGIIDSDYIDEWFATLRVHDLLNSSWEAGDRVLQFVVLPIATPDLQIVDHLVKYSRNGGLGSTGK